MSVDEVKARRYLGLMVALPILSKSQKHLLLRNAKPGFILSLLKMLCLFQDGLLNVQDSKQHKKLLRYRKQINKLRDGPKNDLIKGLCENLNLLNALGEMALHVEAGQLPKFFQQRRKKKISK